MKCPRCRMPVDSDEVQCSVCGELLKNGPGKSRLNTENVEEGQSAEGVKTHTAPSAPRLEITPALVKLGVAWMVCCVIFSLVSLAFAFHEFSTEAMWAAFVAAGLASLPILYVIFGRTVEAAYWYRKELMILCGIGGGVFCVYLLARAITKSNVHVETAGMQEMVTNENFTKTLMTFIICLSVIVLMIPVARMLLKSSTIRTFTNRYEIDSKQDMHTRTSENATSLELRRLELAHETEMQRLELERYRVQIEADRVNLLAQESKLMLTAQEGGATRSALSQSPETPQSGQQSPGDSPATGAPPPPPPYFPPSPGGPPPPPPNS